MAEADLERVLSFERAGEVLISWILESAIFTGLKLGTLLPVWRSHAGGYFRETPVLTTAGFGAIARLER